jgi:hypothetical protein
MKMYKKPITEVTAVDTERLMDGLTVSTNTGGGGGGVAHAPAAPGDIID